MEPNPLPPIVVPGYPTLPRPPVVSMPTTPQPVDSKEEGVLAGRKVKKETLKPSKEVELPKIDAPIVGKESVVLRAKNENEVPGEKVVQVNVINVPVEPQAPQEHVIAIGNPPINNISRQNNRDWIQAGLGVLTTVLAVGLLFMIVYGGLKIGDGQKKTGGILLGTSLGFICLCCTALMTYGCCKDK